MSHWSLLNTTEGRHGNPIFGCVGSCLSVAAVTECDVTAGCMLSQVLRLVWPAGAGLLLHGVPPQRCSLAWGAPGGQAVKALV